MDEGGVDNKSAVRVGLNVVKACLENGNGEYVFDTRKGIWLFANYKWTEEDIQQKNRSQGLLFIRYVFLVVGAGQALDIDNASQLRSFSPQLCTGRFC